MKKILIVEDIKILLEAIKDKLEKAGFQVITARNGQKALEILKNDPPDLMLLDLLLPKQDGFTVLSKVRDDKKLKDLPVVVLTNLSQQEDVDRVKILGIKEYLVKSDVTISSVVEKVKKYVNK